MDNKQLSQVSDFIENTWQYSIQKELITYIKNPCKSPAFDDNWEKNQYLDQAVNQFNNWVTQQEINNIHIKIEKLPNRTPLLYIEIDSFNYNNPDTILLYGHLDKQPEMVGWDDNKGPWLPVIENKKLYGRGGADDGYALFASITAIKSLQQNNLAHPRCVIIIEACEESGSYDLPYYIDNLKDQIRSPNLVICLDSGCGNYDQFWLTTSLRGNIKGVLTVELIKEGLHSGMASGIVPSSFRVARQLLSRIEDEITGEIKINDFYTDIPSDRIKEAEETATILEHTIYSEMPFHDNTQAAHHNHVELLLNRTWRPQLAITGAEGLPEIKEAGNVMRPKTSLVLSMRIPPYIDSHKAINKLKDILERNPPYNAKVRFIPQEIACGWNSPSIEPWLHNIVNHSSELIFKKPAASWGEGGTIPFMSMLGDKFPKAQFVITGVLGPKSNAHGPNEFLHLEMATKLTKCIAIIINKFCNK